MFHLVLLVLTLTGWVSAQDEFISPVNSTDPTVDVFLSDELNTKFVIFKRKATWENAKYLCQSYKYELAMLKDEATAKFVSEALAETNIVGNELWIGARMKDKVMHWLDDIVFPTAPPSNDTSKSNFPFFATILPGQAVPTTACVAFGRSNHLDPMYTYMSCGVPRGFVCSTPLQSHDGDKESQPDEVLPPIPYKTKIFHVYHAQYTWEDSVAFCASKGYILAAPEDLRSVKVIARVMLRTRPVIENAWIGAKYDKDYYQWIREDINRIILNEIDKENKYPPWLTSHPKPSGCLLLDRHLCEDPVFVSAHCGRRRAIVCEEEKEDDRTIITEGPPTAPGLTDRYYISTYKLAWKLAFKECISRTVDGNSPATLATIKDEMTLNIIIQMMAWSKQEIKHVWVAGKLGNITGNSSTHLRDFIWMGTPDDKEGQTSRNGALNKYFCDTPEEINENMACLNIDRENHNHALMYGMSCKTPQYFICYNKDGKFKQSLHDGADERQKKPPEESKTSPVSQTPPTSASPQTLSP